MGLRHLDAVLSRAAIEQIAEELCRGRETVEGSRVVEVIDASHQEDTSSVADEAVGAFSDRFQTQACHTSFAALFTPPAGLDLDLIMFSWTISSAM